MTTIERLSETLGVEPFWFFISISQWGNRDKLHYISILDELNKNVNALFDNYRKIVAVDNKKG